MNPMRGQGRILALLALKDGIVSRQISQILDIRPSSLNESLGRLEARGLIERRKSESDGRRVEVYLTEAGRDAAKALEARDPSAMFDCLTDEEREQLGMLLDKVIQSARDRRHGVAVETEEVMVEKDPEVETTEVEVTEIDGE